MQYLPSKKFIIILSSVFGVILLVFIIGSLIGRKERAVNLQIENEIAVNQEKLSDLVSKDSAAWNYLHQMLTYLN